MRLLITGGNGLLGSNLIKYFYKKTDWEVIATSLSLPKRSTGIEFVVGDLADAQFTGQLIDKCKPDAVINTVGLVDIVKCANEPKSAWRINVSTVENLTKALNKRDIRLIHISTDHLFAGTKSFYSEDDTPQPVNNYGQTKLESEGVCLKNHENTAVVRTNFYGWYQGARKTFGEWLHESLRDKKPINLFTNYFFTPIEIEYLASALGLVAKSDFTGIINIAGAERCSKYEFGATMAEVFGFSLEAVTKTEMDPSSFKVPRQADLSLATNKFAEIFKYQLPDLRSGLTMFRDTQPVNE